MAIIPNRSLNGVVKEPALVVAPTKVNFGRSSIIDLALGPFPMIISKLNERKEPVIFILWGSFARSKKELITNKSHKIIESAHPSPLSASRGFFGSKPCSRTNNYLKMMNKKQINW